MRALQFSARFPGFIRQQKPTKPELGLRIRGSAVMGDAGVCTLPFLTH